MNSVKSSGPAAALKVWAAASMLVILSVALSLAQAPDATGKQLLLKYTDSDDTDTLLHHPQVRPQLQKLLGTELPHLEENLDVSGPVDVVGGDLSIAGNAPHKGTEEEAVVCIGTYRLVVSAAIYSKGSVTVFSQTASYDDLPRCIKDWITLVNSEHRDRVSQPKNVRIVVNK